MSNQSIHLFGGGTMQHVRNHLALCAPAYGGTVRQLCNQLAQQGVPESSIGVHLTKMAGGRSLETNDDVRRELRALLADYTVKAVVFNVALCDFSGTIGEVRSDKYAERIQSREGLVDSMRLIPAAKVLPLIKELRPDVFLVGFKTTAGADVAEQIRLSQRQIHEAGSDLVVANDTVTRRNLLVAANGSHYEASRDAILQLVAARLKGLE